MINAKIAEIKSFKTYRLFIALSLIDISYLQDSSSFKFYIPVLTQNEAVKCGKGQPTFMDFYDKSSTILCLPRVSLCFNLFERQKTKRLVLRKKTTANVQKVQSIFGKGRGPSFENI